MKKISDLRFSKRILKDIEIIAKFKGVKTSQLVSHLVKGIDSNLNEYVKNKKRFITEQLEGQWIFDKMSDSEFKRIMGMDIPKSLRQEKMLHKHDAEFYKEYARKALLMNIQI